jgi:endoglucanase
MSAELSHGLPWLYATGNQIRSSDTGSPILLRGVNRSGLEYSAPHEDSGFLDAAVLTRRDIEEIVSGWRCNIVRLPFNQDWILRGCGGHSAESYLSALDQVIEWIASCGAYTLLDLQWVSADIAYGHLADGSPNYVAPLPNPGTIDAWTVLAERYREEPAIVFDLFNEPHDRLSDDPNPLWRVNPHGGIDESEESRVGPDHWAPWARKLIDAIHPIHPQALIWISGVNWGYDLRGVRIDGPNVVYSAHVYPDRPDWEWRDRFGFAGVDAPLFVGEWGGGDDDVEWGARLLSFTEGRTCGWTAWSWVDRPQLVRDARAGDYTATRFGELVRSVTKSVPAGGTDIE